VLGFTKDEQLAYFKVVSAVLNLGNISVKSDRQDQAQLSDMTSVEKVCHILGINATEFAKGLLRPRIQAGRDWVSQSRTCDQVQYSIEALSRALYERMFTSLVKRINQAIDPESATSTFIGVLDIAGFEIFEVCFDYNARIV
jgi:myosin heavy subunit